MIIFCRRFNALNPEQVAAISPERLRIVKVFAKHIDAAIAESGSGYDVTFQGLFAATPIQREITVSARGAFLRANLSLPLSNLLAILKNRN
jgi:hypothetical protein